MYGLAFGLMDFTSILVLIPAIIFVSIAQGMVKTNFARYSGVKSGTGLTGAQAARKMLDRNGLTDVEINQVEGSLTDHYDPRTRTVNLSESVCNVDSVSAVSVACHECGHALQHAHRYFPLTFRGAIVPFANFASSMSWILVIGGIILTTMSGMHGQLGFTLMNLGVAAFLVVILFHLVTLPVELNASRRAIEQVRSMGLVSPDNIGGAKKVLKAAAMTYIGALAMAVANLLRVLIIVGAGRRD